MYMAWAMRALRWCCIACFLAAPALAGTPERDKAWDALISAAKAHGGAETKLDRSASFVFQRPDGSYLSLTRLLTTNKGRSICLIAKDENATACIDWDSGKLTLGSRADPATPWKFRSSASLDAFEAEQPGFFQTFLSSLQGSFGKNSRGGKSGPGGFWHYQNGGMTWVNTPF